MQSFKHYPISNPRANDLSFSPSSLPMLFWALNHERQLQVNGTKVLKLIADRKDADPFCDGEGVLEIPGSGPVDFHEDSGY